jgi:hypothetical protein
VPHARRLVKDAPNIEADGQRSKAEEAELYRHYGLDYDTVTADSDQTASQPGGPADQDQPTAPPATDEQAAAPAGGPAQRRSGEEPAATDAIGSAQPATEDGFEVGEGLSRPFVYETPGPSHGRPGSRQRQPGQVRLRRYLVTEVVTETESGQPGDPVETAPTEPHDNDWLRSEGDPPR